MSTTNPAPYGVSIKSMVIAASLAKKRAISLSYSTGISFAITFVSLVFSDSSRASPSRGPPHPIPDNTRRSAGC
ncbi:MAG TPA: hypothetical protein PLH80_08525 [Spirochaetota bacterium]|nr:hypothetical protein [Spirochaetota bacterium]HOF13175.1 hypothetical protein [Spirochaetota bacterium]HOR92800.1 hypothetical protein [Spirochaetota bacterium]HPD04755.1 hypothetical protein [Spirochaetota bacterium]HPK43385.1 hypothetical protein [Spirochaetota bacterium]